MLRTRRPFRDSLASALLCLFITSLLTGPARAQSEEGATNPSGDAAGDVLVHTAPVTIDGKVLFGVRGVSSYPAEHRAAVMESRIVELARDPTADPKALRIVDYDTETRILDRDSTVMRILDADAALEGVMRHTLAEVYREEIADAVIAYRAARTRQALVDSGWRAVAATLAAVVAFFVLRRSVRSLRRRIESRYRDRLAALTVRKFELVRGDRLWAFVEGALRFLGVVLLLVLVFVYLRYTLGLFPWTQGAANNLAAWALAPITNMASSLISILPNLLFLTVLFLVTRYFLRLIRLFFTAAGRGEIDLERFHPEWAEPTYNLVRVLVIALAIVTAYPYIPGSDSLAFKGISVFAGIMFSLGSSSAIANIVAGYILIYRRVFAVGDVVKIGGVVGRVTDVRLQVTTIRTIKNEEVIVPNSTIVATEVINYSSLVKSDGLILHTTVGINYSIPWQQVEAMLLEAAARTPGLRSEPKPFVLQTALGDFAVTHQINVYMDTATTMSKTYAALHRNILDVFNEYGVQIMTPAYEGDPETPKVVPPSEWYPAPAAKKLEVEQPAAAAPEPEASAKAIGGATVIP